MNLAATGNFSFVIIIAKAGNRAQEGGAPS